MGGEERGAGFTSPTASPRRDAIPDSVTAPSPANPTPFPPLRARRGGADEERGSLEEAWGEVPLPTRVPQVYPPAVWRALACPSMAY